MITACVAASVLAATALAASYDYRAERPGARHRIRVEELPAPGATSDSRNPPDVVARPAGAKPSVLAGFAVELYAEGLDEPRQLKVAPNGDLFVAESEPGRILVFRGKTPAVFLKGLDRPFGLAFHGGFLYIGDTGAVVRVHYVDGDLRARAKPERVLAVPSGGFLEGGGHWTRDLAFSKDGKTLFISVGSRANIADVDEDKSEFHRACILAADPDGKNVRVYASGLRNAVSLAVEPASGALWATVNERDRLGDDLPPDYLTRVREGGFYGWPWYYIGGHEDPRLPGRHPELKDKVIVPDLLLEPNIAPLGLAFFDGGIVVAAHGSWNRSRRVGYEVLRAELKDRKTTGAYEDFLTGFVTEDGRVWGRPVGVAVGRDGSLFVSDDAGGRIWRVFKK